MKNLFMVFTLIFSSVAFAKTFNSGTQQIALLELFSSEGCSSCPAAEKKIYALRSDLNLWKNFTPINFHVDYWNQLGWNDRFSRDQFTKRQNNYATLWNVTRIYTPEFVLNGQELGSDLKTISTDKKQKVIPLILNSSANKISDVEIHFKPTDSRNLKVYFAVLGNNLESKVTAGENKGEVLKHNFVVLSLDEKEINSTQKTEVIKVQFPWPELKEKPNSLSVVSWIVDSKSSKYIQSIGGDL